MAIGPAFVPPVSRPTVKKRGLGFWETLKRSWHLIVASWNILVKDKELIFLPALSGLVVLALFVPFALAFLLAGDPTVIHRSVGFIVFYCLASAFSVEFFNAALIAGALTRFRGGDPTIRSSLRAALGRLGSILGWGFITFTVGQIINLISGSGRREGPPTPMDIIRSILGKILGYAWRFVTFLVLPVIMAERRGPLAAIRRSFELVRTRWGEVIAGSVGIWAIGIFIMIGVGTLLLLMVVALTFLTLNPWVMMGSILFTVIVLVLIGLVLSALNQFFATAVYLYAAEGRIPAGFEPEDVKGAFITG
jgi:hypothetical protein